MNDKVYWFRGWKLKRLEGVVKGYVSNLFGEAKAVILITESESDSYQVSRYDTVNVSDLHFIP